MPVAFIKKHGAGKSVLEYIELGGKDMHCYPKVTEMAKEMYRHLGMTTTYNRAIPRMMAAVMLFLAAKNEGQYISSGRWTEIGFAPYNSLIEHAKNLIPLLEDEFPGLKGLKIGK